MKVSRNRKGGSNLNMQFPLRNPPVTVTSGIVTAPACAAVEDTWTLTAAAADSDTTIKASVLGY
eukprot:2281005-Rhodomonas_salina.1